MTFVSILISLLLASAHASPLNEFDCQSPVPEMAGFHNMVLFGHPDTGLYAHHLPLFKGDVNGNSGHVLMHIYQTVFKVSLDEKSALAFKNKFEIESTTNQPIPFFSLAPRGERFKVPDAICEELFQTKAIIAFGHVEGNPDFPAPEAIQQDLSVVQIEESLFAQRFSSESLNQLTYLVFGEKGSYFMAHVLTADENSFDQILAIEIEDEKMQEKIATKGKIYVSLPTAQTLITQRPSTTPLNSPNNSHKVQFMKEGVLTTTKGISLKLQQQIYYNENRDLQVN